MRVKIAVATHKKYEMPKDEGYFPIHVGKKGKQLELGYCGDDTKENISDLNPYFCELTALYWLWKNDDSDVIGLVHYRRYFKADSNAISIVGKKIANSTDFNLNQYDIVVAKPRNYYITSIKKHYCKAHYEKDYNLLLNEIEQQYPSYLKAFDQVMSSSKISLYNMFVAKRSIIEPYFEWLFSLLFALEKKINYTQYDAYQKRIFGFMAERLFNVWLLKNKSNLKIEYRAVINVEGEPILKKGVQFIKRQFFTGKA